MPFAGPAFGTQVLEINPERLAGGHFVNEGIRQVTGKCFNDNRVGQEVGQGFLPVNNIDGINLLLPRPRHDPGVKAGKAGQVIDPQAYRAGLCPSQLAGQAPAYPDVTEIIDDFAENIDAIWSGQNGRPNES